MDIKTATYLSHGSIFLLKDDVDFSDSTHASSSSHSIKQIEDASCLAQLRKEHDVKSLDFEIATTYHCRSSTTYALLFVEEEVKVGFVVNHRLTSMHHANQMMVSALVHRRNPFSCDVCI